MNHSQEPISSEEAQANAQYQSNNLTGGDQVQIGEPTITDNTPRAANAQKAGG